MFRVHLYSVVPSDAAVAVKYVKVFREYENHSEGKFILGLVRDKEIECFDIIIKEKGEEMLELRDGRDHSIFHEVGYHGRINFGEWLLKNGNNINVGNWIGTTPLMDAADNGKAVCTMN